MNKKTKDWVVALLYVTFIYSTLSVVRGPVNFLRSLGILNLSLTLLYVGCFLMSLSFLYRSGTKSAGRYFLLISFFLIYLFIGKNVQSPEEKIHFFEYGLVGIFFLQALKNHSHSIWKIYLGAVILGTIAGWVDELIQGLLPSRQYDIRDIYLNTISVVLGLLIHSVFPPHSSVLTSKD